MTCPQVIEVVAQTGPEVIEFFADTAPQVLEVVTPGPPGIQGPGSPTYQFTASSPSTTWTINHNLGFKPSVELLNSGSQEIDGDVVHTSVNQTVVTFTAAVAGFARLN